MLQFKMHAELLTILLCTLSKTKFITKFSEITAELSTYSANIIFITETWLSPVSALCQYQIPGYSFFSQSKVL